MADAARKHGRPDAAAAIVDDLIAWLGGPSERAHRIDDAEDDGGGGGARFAPIDFRAGRSIAMQRRSRRPPPPAHLEIVSAPLLD
jgi:hypothetical protein